MTRENDLNILYILTIIHISFIINSGSETNNSPNVAYVIQQRLPNVYMSVRSYVYPARGNLVILMILTQELSRGFTSVLGTEIAIDGISLDSD